MLVWVSLVPQANVSVTFLIDYTVVDLYKNLIKPIV